jgi:hypothetical protein
MDTVRLFTIAGVAYDGKESHAIVLVWERSCVQIVSLSNQVFKFFCLCEWKEGLAHDPLMELFRLIHCHELPYFSLVEVKKARKFV